MTKTQQVFTLTRRLGAPRSAVFQAWTDPAQLDWFYNDQHEATMPTTVDLRVGGAWRQQMIIDESTSYTTGGIYLEIVTDEKIVFAWGAVDGWPLLDVDKLTEGPVVTVTFSGDGPITDLRLDVSLPAYLSEADARVWLESGMQNGWAVTVDRLVAALSA